MAVRSCCILLAALVRAARKVGRGTGPAPGGGQYRDRARNGSFLLTNTEAAMAACIDSCIWDSEIPANCKLNLTDIRTQAISFIPLLLFVYILQYLKGW